MDRETGFEKARGVSKVEVRPNSAQVHVKGLRGQIMEKRIRILKSIADAGVSIDFLKLTPDGLSCLIAEEQSSRVEKALSDHGASFIVSTGRSVVLVHAVNMRDEEGLTAKIIQKAIGIGIRIEHISDMHDRMLLVVLSEEADRLKEGLEDILIDEHAGGRR